jgi:hypothetical protein
MHYPFQYQSSIFIPVNKIECFRFWQEEKIDPNGVQIHDSYNYSIDNRVFTSYLIYSKGVAEHQDRHLTTPYSALLILHNKGFFVWQDGLEFNKQETGSVILLNIHETHELAAVDDEADKWAALCLDYHQPLEPEVVEIELKKNLNRIFLNAN